MNRVRSNLMLLLAALIWGCAFVAQSVGMDYVGPITFNCLRSLIGSAALLPLLFWMDRHHPHEERTAEEKKKVYRGGVVCGIILCIASLFQQYGIQYTSVGKAGFITALYVVLVPILGLFIGKKAKPAVWGCALLAAVGMYFLSVNGAFALSTGDFLVFICAILFACHILAVDHYSFLRDGIRLSCIQFFTAGILCLIPMLVIEKPTMQVILAAAGPILYAGVLSSGAGYTLQILGQQDADPAVASLILSLESVFAALAGWLILHETLSSRELFGCCLVFAAIIIAQLPSYKKPVER